MAIALRSKTSFTTAAIFCAGLGLIAFARSFEAEKRRPPAKFILPPKDLVHFTLGYREIVADSMWLRVIQDYDVCEQNKPADWHPEDENPGFQPVQSCHLGWVYHFLDAITELSPRFRIPYVTGGVMLSTIVNDPEGSSLIFDKGLKAFPDDWHILYYAGYHEMADMKRIEKAAGLLLRAAQNGAPGWIYSLAGRLFSRVGQAEFAKKVLEETLESDPESRWSESIRNRIRELDREIKSAQAAPTPASQ